MPMCMLASTHFPYTPCRPAATKFELFINLLTVPLVMQMTADEVIE